MPSPLKGNIVLKARDEGIAERSILVPCGIHGRCILPLYQDLLDSVLVKMVLSFVKDYFGLQPNGNIFTWF
jgi:hypothetical protein